MNWPRSIWLALVSINVLTIANGGWFVTPLLFFTLVAAFEAEE